MSKGIVSQIYDLRGFLVPLCIIVGLLVIVTPLPAPIMDMLLVANIAISMIVLMTAIYIRTPLEFSVFPTLLLATVLARLVLNIASTRLILTKAASGGVAAAGGVIQSFGEFVAGNQIAVGLVIFAIIAVIQFIVITKGATRISEVAARFTLDGMPGRQMAIDADLNSGVITEQEAVKRRAEILQQADFYGAMDGASKFIRGDAIAAVFITLINVVGGLAIGIIQYQMQPVEALSVFTMLTIGDGLVSQLPALLISLAAGILITRSTQRVNLPETFVNQVFMRPEVLAISAAFLLLLTVTGLPKFPLLTLGSSCAGIAIVLFRKENEVKSETELRNREKSKQTTKKPESRIEELLNVDPIEIELGVSLLRHVDSQRGGVLLSRINQLRQRVALDLGIVLPKVRIRDNLRLPEHGYRVKINGTSVAHAELPETGWIATGGVDQEDVAATFEHPLFRQPVPLVDAENRAEVESKGANVWDAVSLLIGHLHRITDQYASELLSRDLTKHLIDELRKTSPTIVEEVIPNVLRLSQLQHVLQSLLAENIPIRQLALIMETLGDVYQSDMHPNDLTEKVRQRLSRTICQRYRDKTNRIYAVTMDPMLESQIQAATATSSTSHQSIRKTISDELENLVRTGHKPILLVRANVRKKLFEMLHENVAELIVLSYDEITNDTKVVSVGIASEVRKS